MTGARARRYKRRLRWALWRAGLVLLLTAVWSAGKLHVSTIGDFVVAVVVVAVLSVLLSRMKRSYQALKGAFRETGKRAWEGGHREAARRLARALDRFGE